MTKPGPGKFEMNDSLEESEILYDHFLDASHPELGDSGTGFGYWCYIESDTFTPLEKTVCQYPVYICVETEYGFFVVTPYNSLREARDNWAKLESEWMDWNKEELS
jgi:hypothetical protein